MSRITQLFLVLLLTVGLVATTGLAATAAPDEGGVQLQNRHTAKMQVQHRQQTQVRSQQDQYLTASGPVVGLNADRDQDRLKDGTGDGDPDRDQTRLQIRLMDCVDEFLDWLRGTGSR